MIDIFSDTLAEILHDAFSVLDQHYVEDQAKDVEHSLQCTFDSMYDVRFTVIHMGTEQPVWPYTFRDRRQAEAAIELHTDKDHLSVALVLIEK